MDVTDMVEYNIEVLNRYDLTHSFFHVSREDPTVGFDFDATHYAGHIHPRIARIGLREEDETLSLRLILGSHLALHLRHQLEEQHGYTSTVGISTSKLLSKLVGNLNKPKGQTTLVPPYDHDEAGSSNVRLFVDQYEIGKIPRIGHKLAQQIREYVLGHPAKFDNHEGGLVYGESKEVVTVGQVRQAPDMSAEFLSKLLAGPGFPHDSGHKIFALLHGVDEGEVAEARNVPRQISIEDSYLRLDSMDQVTKELEMLAARLVDRMRVDLTEPKNDEEGTAHDNGITTEIKRRWIGRPETLRLTTRPRLPLNADGTRTRTFKRISRSAPIPSFIFNLNDKVHAVAEKLVAEALVPLFKRLHPERKWDLSLVNVAVTNMTDTASGKKGATGRDIETMFKRQDTVLDCFKVMEESTLDSGNVIQLANDEATFDDDFDDFDDQYSDAESDTSMQETIYLCSICKQRMPAFAKMAHERFHEMERRQ